MNIYKANFYSMITAIHNKCKEVNSMEIINLTSTQWAGLYSVDKAKNIYESIKKEKFSAQTLEMLKIVGENQYRCVCEIGCGSGQTAIALAMHGVHVTAVDYQEQSLHLVKAVAELAGTDTCRNIELVCCNAQEKLPFDKNQFDTIYHAGLLEHFTSEERIHMLCDWKEYCGEMISMVPNGASVAYRYGKEKMMKNGTWPYGIENIIYTPTLEFINAGLTVDSEYTIGLSNSMNFLDDKNYLKIAMKKLWKENFLEDDCHQGYLLVTRGKRSN